MDLILVQVYYNLLLPPVFLIFEFLTFFENCQFEKFSKMFHLYEIFKNFQTAFVSILEFLKFGKFLRSWL